VTDSVKGVWEEYLEFMEDELGRCVCVCVCVCVCGCGRCDLFTLVCQLTADGLHSAACEGKRCCRFRSSSKKICVGIFVVVAVYPSQTLRLDHTIFLKSGWIRMRN
jgi:hypothetical protein